MSNGYVKRIVLIFMAITGVNLLFPAFVAYSQFPRDSINLFESEVVPYILPDPLQISDGRRVRNAGQWETIQRPHIYRLFEENVYGRFPTKKVGTRYRIREYSEDALNERAIRKQIRIYLKPTDTTVHIDVLIYLPKNMDKSVPVFLGLNFEGNATVQNDPDILLSDNPVFPGWVNAKPGDPFLEPNDERARGRHMSRWPVLQILEEGYGLVTACYSDLEIDLKDGWKTGIRGKLQNELAIVPEEWGAIGAWAWGLSQIMDYLETDKDIDAKKVAVLGLSRLGKTALWAGASDTRFSLVISNESGGSGAALSRRWYGETVASINNVFPYWFVDKYKEYGDDVFSLPVDQHELLALIAPRPLYVASAEEDRWADPKGEFLSAWYAGQVYTLFGKKGVGTSLMPEINTAVGDNIRYHVRSGVHDLTLFDWEQYLRFAKQHWDK